MNSCVQPADLVSTDEDVIARRKTILTLLKEYKKLEESGEMRAPPEGKAFHAKNWDGIKKGQ
jgi:hypothetical protein